MERLRNEILSQVRKNSKPNIELDEEERIQLLKNIQELKANIEKEKFDINNITTELGKIRTERIELEKSKSSLGKLNKEFQNEIGKLKFQHEEVVKSWEKKLKEIDANDNPPSYAEKVVETFPSKIRRKVIAISGSCYSRGGLKKWKSNHMPNYLARGNIEI